MEIRNIPYELTWNMRHSVMWPDETIEYVKLPNDKDGLHFGLFVDDQMISVISLFKTGDSAQFRKFATLNSEQGKGYGSKLLNYLFLQVDDSETAKVWCNARADKIHFYKRFGMHQTEKKFIKGGKSYVIMEKCNQNTLL
jgi:predicted GNAT family N-acyltransferase